MPREDVGVSAVPSPSSEIRHYDHEAPEGSRSRTCTPSQVAESLYPHFPNNPDGGTFYVATTGSDSNAGTALSPFLTFQKAFDAIAEFGPVLRGNWVIEAAAGTYTISDGQQTFSTPSVNRVIIRGPAVGHPNVPTCIIDGGGNQAAYLHGISISGSGTFVEVRDILFQNFTQASGNQRVGLLAENQADIYTRNVHTTACSWTGILLFSAARGRISGGIIDGDNISGSAGITANDVEATIGYGDSSTAEGPVIKNCAQHGIYWSRGSQGHIDYVTFEDNGVGLEMEHFSTAALPGCDFKRNAVAIRMRPGSSYREDGVPVILNHGTADENPRTFDFYMGGPSAELRLSRLNARVTGDRTQRTATGIVTGTFPVVYTLPEYRMVMYSTCRVRARGVYTVTAGSTITVNFGGMACELTVPAAATGVSFEMDMELLETLSSGGVPGFRAIGKLSAGLSSVRFGTFTTGFDKTVANDISVGYSLTGAGDTLNIYRTDVYIEG